MIRLLSLLWFIFCLFAFNFLCAQTQQTFLFYDFQSSAEKPIFEKKIESGKWQSTLDSLVKIGYYTLQLDSVIDQKVYLKRGKLYQNIWVKNNELFQNKNDYFPTKNLDSIIAYFNQKEVDEGRIFSSIVVESKGFENNELQVELHRKQAKKRTIDGVKLVGYEKMSRGFIKHQLQIRVGETFREDKLITIQNEIRQNQWIRETRSPNVMYQEDSTYIYLYTEKIKANIFDGIIGFGTDEDGKFRMNGNLSLELNNNFNAMEQIRLNWIGTAAKNTTLDIRLKFPYLFGSKIGSETNLKLFKQDSVFVNTNLQERFFYQLTPQSNIGVNLGIQSSNFVLEEYPTIATNYDDYQKLNLGLSYDYFQGTDQAILEGKQRLYTVVNSIRKKEKNLVHDDQAENQTSNQYEIGLETYRLFRLGKKHYLKGRFNFYGLFDKANHFAENELYRIGGFGSLRGFNEESITANLYATVSAEYRFLPNEAFYIALFSDYASIQNKRINVQTNLMSLGTGIAFLTKLGVFNINYAVGKTGNLPFDFKDSKIHFGIISKF